MVEAQQKAYYSYCLGYAPPSEKGWSEPIHYELRVFTLS